MENVPNYTPHPPPRFCLLARTRHRHEGIESFGWHGTARGFPRLIAIFPLRRRSFGLRCKRRFVSCVFPFFRDCSRRSSALRLDYRIRRLLTSAMRIYGIPSIIPISAPLFSKLPGLPLGENATVYIIAFRFQN